MAQRHVHRGHVIALKNSRKWTTATLEGGELAGNNATAFASQLAGRLGPKKAEHHEGALVLTLAKTSVRNALATIKRAIDQVIALAKKLNGHTDRHDRHFREDGQTKPGYRLGLARVTP